MTALSFIKTSKELLKMKITPIKSNMTQLDLADGTSVLFSYSTPVACYKINLGYFRTTKKWSQTTTRHINHWLDGREATQTEQVFFDNLVQGA